MLINAIFCAGHILASSHISNLMRNDLNGNNRNDEEAGQREMDIDENESKKSESIKSEDEESKHSEIGQGHIKKYADEENEDIELESQMDALPASKTKDTDKTSLMQKMKSYCASPFQPIYMVVLVFHLLWLVNGIWELLIQISSKNEEVYECQSVVVKQTIISIACGLVYIIFFLIGFGLYTAYFEPS